MSTDPGPQPEPQAEEPEKFPGGADAIEPESGKYGPTPGGPTTRDLSPDDNPAVEDVLPDEIVVEDKQQEGDASDPDEQNGDKESP